MAFEARIAGAEDKLLDSLRFTNRASASYITSSRNVTFNPSSAAAHKPSGVRLIRFLLASESGWVRGPSLRLIFTITNLSTQNALTPITDSPASLFRRMRIIANGSSVVEDIESYGRVVQMFSMLDSSQSRYNRVVEGWGGTAAASSLSTPFTLDAIPASGSRTVCCELLSPFLAQEKHIGLHFLPLTLELEMADADTAFASTGNDFEITRPRLVADVVQLETSIDNSFALTLKEGKSIPIYSRGIYCVQAAVPNDSKLYSLAIARGFTRLTHIFVSFWDGAGKEVTRFYSPLDTKANTAAEDTMTYNLTIGSDRFPNFDNESVGESFYRLRQALMGLRGHADVSISPAGYRTNQFVMAQSLEKAPGDAAHTGYNTRSGSQVMLQLRNTGATTTVYVVLVHETIVNLSAAGVEVLD